MNHLPREFIERQLINELRKAEHPYRRALAVMEATAPGPQPDTQAVNLCLQRLEPMMLQIQQLEGTLAPLRQHWLTLGQKPGSELRQVLEVHEQLLGGLVGRIHTMETELQEQRQQLMPNVDRFVRHQQMHRAYQNSRGS